MPGYERWAMSKGHGMLINPLFDYKQPTEK